MFLCNVSALFQKEVDTNRTANDIYGLLPEGRQRILSQRMVLEPVCSFFFFPFLSQQLIPICVPDFYSRHVHASLRSKCLNNGCSEVFSHVLQVFPISRLITQLLELLPWSNWKSFSSFPLESWLGGHLGTRSWLFVALQPVYKCCFIGSTALLKQVRKGKGCVFIEKETTCGSFQVRTYVMLL